MILYIAWLLIFSSVFLSVFYLSIYSDVKNTRTEELIELEEYPSITILMPAYDESEVVEEALNSVKDLDYPNYQVIFVNDASTDDTLNKAKKFASEKVSIISHEVNKGKAAALNTGIAEVDTDYMVVQDADSKIDSELLYKAVGKMERDSKLGAVIAAIKPLKADNFVRKLQTVEYQLTNFYRMLMTEINTLNVTPGAFSIYRTENVKDVGGFDEGNITEDLEMAFKLRKDGKLFEMIYFNTSYTDFPATLKALYNQRVRWARGFIYNGWKYKEMFFNREYGYFGTVQLPMLVLMPALIVTSFGMVITGISQSIFNFLVRTSAIGFQIPEFTIESLYLSFLAANVKVYLPLLLSLILVAFIIKKAYNYSGERPKNIPALLFYFFAYFLLQSGFWVAALLKEVTRSKKVWT